MFVTNVCDFRSFGHQLAENRIKRLQVLSTPSNGDERHKRYVNYANAFLKAFGEERIYLVGSTGETSKLRWSTDDGDSDFIFVSGRLAIPVENIEHRTGMEDYVWIKTTNLNSEQFYIDENTPYLFHEMLKTVSQNLFTILRGIYRMITPINDSTYGRTGTALRSKVGIATQEYENLEFDGWPGIESSKDVCPRDSGRSDAFNAYLRERWSGLSVNEAEINVILRILNVISSLTFPISGGKLSYVSALVSEVLQRPRIYTFHDAIHKVEVSGRHEEMQQRYAASKNETSSDLYVKATYTKKRSMDFVPALRVIGKLRFMDNYLNRVENKSWPGIELATKIYKSDIFIISRLPPVHSNAERDFRLSFNLAEVMLVNSFPQTAKNVFIILKSYLKGAFKRAFGENKNKLISYHLKTAMLWVCEQESLQFWEETEIATVIHIVMRYLQGCIITKRLSHYFIESNLFLDIEDSEAEILSAVIERILEDPMGSIDIFFEIDKEVKGEVLLSSEEVKYLRSLTKDGGRGRIIDEIEDAMTDFIRGFNESPKDINKFAPIKEALMNTLDTFLQDEQEFVRYTGGDSEKDNDFIYQVANRFVKGQLNLHDLYHSLNTLPAYKKWIKDLGGITGLQKFQKEAKEEPSKVRGKLRAAAERFIDCTDETEEQATFEFKQAILIYTGIKKIFYTKEKQRL